MPFGKKSKKSIELSDTKKAKQTALRTTLLDHQDEDEDQVNQWLTTLLSNPSQTIDGDPEEGNEQGSLDIAHYRQILAARNCNFITLKRILKIEYSKSFHPPRWIYLDSALERAMRFLLLQATGIHDPKTNQGWNLVKYPGKRLWIPGQNIPLKSWHEIKKAAAVTSFRQGFEFILMRGLQLSIYVFLIVQLINAQNFKQVVDTFVDSKKNSIRDIIYELASHNQAYVAVALSLPFLWGIFKAIFKTVQLRDFSEKRLTAVIADLDAMPTGLWPDGFRWVLPLHPIDKHLRCLLTHILWNGNLSSEQVQKALDAIIRTAATHPYYTRVACLSTISIIAHGVEFPDLVNNKAHFSIEQRLHQVALKTNAFELIQSQAKPWPAVWKENQQKPRGFLEKLQATAQNINAHYLLWSLGDSRSMPESIFFWCFKLGKLALIIALFTKIILQTIEYFDCPKKPGFTFAGYQHWASDYTVACFDALVESFNIIPDQPASDLIEKINQYHFPDNKYDLSLPGKGITSAVMLEIIQGFYYANPRIVLTSLNLAGNNVNDPSVIEQIIPMVISIRQLDLSGNGLTGEALKVLGNKLPQLKSLTAIELSNIPPVNEIGLNESKAFPFLAKGIATLEQLSSLGLANINIGDTYPNSTIALAEALHYTTRLRHLNLYSNRIGYSSSIASFILAESFATLLHLKTVNLGHNYIASTSNQTFPAIVSGLAHCRQLSEATIGTQTNFRTHLPLSLPPNDIRTMNAALNATKVPALPVPFTDAISVENYLAQQPVNTTTIDFSGKLYKPTNKTVLALMNGLTRFSMLRELNLAANDLWVDVYAAIALGEQLGKLTLLTHLNLGENWLGQLGKYEGIVAISTGISKLFNLLYLNLSGNKIGCDVCIKAMSLALKNLTKLQSINMQGNSLGHGVREIVNSLTHSSKLEYLNLNGNGIEDGSQHAIKILSKSLSQFSQLYFLDVGENPKLGSAMLMDLISLTQSIGVLDNLIHLSIAGTYLGLQNSTVMVTLGKSLSKIHNLKYLNLQETNLGKHGPEGPKSIAAGISHNPQLSFLNLANNDIGSTGPEASEAILSVLPSLHCLKPAELSLAGMQNLSLSNANAIRNKLTATKLQATCESNRCRGKNITVEQPQCVTNKPYQSQLALRTFSSTAMSSRTSHVRNMHPTNSGLSLALYSLPNWLGTLGDNNTISSLFLLGIAMLALTLIARRWQRQPQNQAISGSRSTVFEQSSRADSPQIETPALNY